MSDIDVLKEEYLFLRKEVEAAMEELGTTERYCVYAVAAGFAWLSSKTLNAIQIATQVESTSPYTARFGKPRSEWAVVGAVLSMQ